MFLLPADASNTDYVYLSCAFAGTLFFLLRTGMLMLGGLGDDGDMDMGDHGDGGDHSADGHHTDTTFSLISLNSVSAFFAMFGWAGLSASKQFGWGNVASLMFAIAVGFSVMVLIAYTYYLIRRLQSPGAVFRVADAVGQTAQVYSRIPAKGIGKIHISVNGILRELDARSANGEEIESFATVKITATAPQSQVVVERV